MDREIGKIIDAVESKGILNETIIIFFSDNGPVFDIDPIAATIAPDILDSKGNTLGLKGSKGSAYEGGIRVPAVIYYKGILEKSLSNQFFFVDDILPTLFGALNINPNQNNITGVNRWNDLVKNEIKPPKNVMTGNVIVHDERALFNGKWKLYYRNFVYNENSEKIFELYNVNDDPYEKYELSEKYPDVFESMKKTFDENPLIIETPYINPVQSYLYGDRYIGITDSPWLERTYKEKELPHPIVQNLVFGWIIFLTFKHIIIPVLILLTLVFYFMKFRNNISSN